MRGTSRQHHNKLPLTIKINDGTHLRGFMTHSLQKALLIYSSMISTALLASLVVGAKSQPKSFDEINVHRLNVTESDGTLRLVISNKDRLPPVIIKGKERPEMGEARPQAGMIFYNDEGTENGGLIFSGRKMTRGRLSTPGPAYPLTAMERARQCSLPALTTARTILRGFKSTTLEVRGSGRGVTLKALRVFH